MRSNLPTEKKLNTLVKKSVDLKPLQILGWKGIKSKNTAILTLKYPSWEQKVRRPRVKKSGDKKSGKTSNLQGKLVFVQKWGRRTFSMEIGWFWGEIRVLWWRQLINTAVGHYLWGIDTVAPSGRRPPVTVGHYLWGIDTQTYELHFCSPWGELSDITYEELIPSGRRESLPIHEPSSDITYEELIQSSYDDSHQDFPCRTLPMRNWYVLRQNPHTSSHHHRRTLPMRNWYMHLLHLMAESLSQLHQSDITYEELIPFANSFRNYPWG